MTYGDARKLATWALLGDETVDIIPEPLVVLHRRIISALLTADSRAKAKVKGEGKIMEVIA
jgi:hypothetical protein